MESVRSAVYSAPSAASSVRDEQWWHLANAMIGWPCMVLDSARPFHWARRWCDRRDWDAFQNTGRRADLSLNDWQITNILAQCSMSKCSNAISARQYFFTMFKTWLKNKTCWTESCVLDLVMSLNQLHCGSLNGYVLIFSNNCGGYVRKNIRYPKTDWKNIRKCRQVMAENTNPQNFRENGV